MTSWTTTGQRTCPFTPIESIGVYSMPPTRTLRSRLFVFVVAVVLGAVVPA